MSGQDKAVTAVQQPSVAPGQRAFSMVPKSLEEAWQFAEIIAKSGMCPKGFAGRPADVLVAIQMGAELGVSPIQSLANIAVINGRPAMWGDLVVALVQRSGQCEYLLEHWDEQTQTATAKLRRRGKIERVERFSMADARRAGLATKDTYKTYPQRMCGWRAKTFAIRAEFADILKGLTTAEEAHDLSTGGAIEAAFTVFPAAGANGAPASEPVPADLPPPDDEWARQFAGKDAPSNSEDAAGQLFVTRAEKGGTGTRKDGQPYTWYVIELSDGRTPTTFSETMFTNALQAMRARDPVVAVTEPGKKQGTLNITSLEPA